MKKFKKKVTSCLLVAAMLLSMISLVGCGEGSDKGSEVTKDTSSEGDKITIDLNENIESVNGVYTHTYGYDYLYNCFSNTIKNACSSDEDLFQNDQLILFTTSYEKGDKDPNRGYWETGNRYIYTRDLYVVNLGMHYSQTFYGSYTWTEGQGVTLEQPEMFSYDYVTGDATRWKDLSATDVVVDFEKAIQNEETGKYIFEGEMESLAGAKEGSGLYGFDVTFVNRNHPGNGTALDIVIDLNTMTFDFPEEE